MNSKHWGYGHRRLVQCALGDINAVVDVDISRGTVLSFALIIMDGQGLDRANNSYDEDNDTEQHLDCKRKCRFGFDAWGYQEELETGCKDAYPRELVLHGIYFRFDGLDLNKES